MLNDYDGTAKLCRAIYGREAKAKDYLGGSEAKMLHDAADRIATLTAERDALVAAVRQTESVTKDKTDKQQASEWMMVDAKEWRAVLALAQQDQPTHFCNKCGHFGNTEQHEGCNYLAAQLKEQDDD